MRVEVHYLTDPFTRGCTKLQSINSSLKGVIIGVAHSEAQTRILLLRLSAMKSKI